MLHLYVWNFWRLLLITFPGQEARAFHMCCVCMHHLVSQHERMCELCQHCRAVFGVDVKSHTGHQRAVKQSVLDGTSKWSAKIAITGRSNVPKPAHVSTDGYSISWCHQLNMYRWKTPCYSLGGSGACWSCCCGICLISQRRLRLIQQHRWCVERLIHEMFNEDIGD